MKKFLTLALALVLVLAAVPAMAFTGTTSATAGLTPSLSIYLVNYADSGFFGIATLPAADRGYATNEIVAAVVEVKVPDGYASNALEGFTALELSSTNVSLWVTDAIKFSSNWAPTAAQIVMANGGAISKDTITLPSLADNNTYKLMFFGKVTADGGKLTATLIPTGATGGAFSAGSLAIKLSGTTYTVAKSSGSYAITVGTESTSYKNDVITLNVDSNNKTTGMTITVDGTTPKTYILGVTVGGVLGYVEGAAIVTSGAEYNSVMNVYNDVVKGVFGLDYFKIGNYLYDSFFTGFTATATITASVDIKPWTAYVTVPSEVVVTPPKTGDAAGIMGFVMIVLAAAAAVVVKKVRA